MTPAWASLAARLDAALLPPVIAQIDDVTVGIIDRALDARLSSLALILGIVAVLAIVMIGFYLIRKETRESANDKADRDLMKQQIDNNTALIAKIAITNDLQKQSVELQQAGNAKLDRLNEVNETRVTQNIRAQEDQRRMSETLLKMGEAVTEIARSLAAQQGNVVQGVSIAVTGHLDKRDRELSEARMNRDLIVDTKLEELNQKIDLILKKLGIPTDTPPPDTTPDATVAVQPEPPAETKDDSDGGTAE